ncbi:hypothetical protein QQ045_007147 [Rhodiola kirilowii]
MQIRDFIWRPYDESLFHILNPICLEGRNSWRANVPLISFNVIGWHHPGRVMRQFGCRQFIPPQPIAYLDENHAKDRKPKVDWGVHHYRLIQPRIEGVVDDAVVVEDAVEAEVNPPEQIRRTQPYRQMDILYQKM